MEGARVRLNDMTAQISFSLASDQWSSLSMQWNKLDSRNTGLRDTERGTRKHMTNAMVDIKRVSYIGANGTDAFPGPNACYR